MDGVYDTHGPCTHMYSPVRIALLVEMSVGGAADLTRSQVLLRFILEQSRERDGKSHYDRQRVK